MIIVCCCSAVVAQLPADSTIKKPVKPRLFYEYCVDSTAKHRVYMFRVDKGSHVASAIRNPQMKVSPPVTPPVQKKTPWLTVHGNVLYDVNYYSNIDTPYSQKDVYQHTVQTYLDITLKDHYPMRLFFTTRFGNSYMFKSFSDLNLLYNSQQFRQGIKDQLKQRVLMSVPALAMIDSLKGLLDAKRRELSALERQQQDPASLQRMIEARERAYFRKRALDTTGLYSDADSLLLKLKTDKDSIQGTIGKPSVNSTHSLKTSLVKNIRDSVARLLSRKAGKDSLQTITSRKDSNELDSLEQSQQTNRKKIDSLRQQITALQDKYDRLRALSAKRSDASIKEIDGIRSVRELQDKMDEYHIPDSSMPKGYKTMMAIKRAGIGRNIVNYSELSVKNISINGVQVEYNPSFYLAFAAGTVDYRFRDFIIQQNRQPKQYVGVIRAGLGMKEGNNVIFTYYAGRRQLYNSFTDTINSNVQAPNPYLMGFTIEGNYRIGAHHLLTGEIAKSSMPYYTNGNKPDNLLAGTVRFKDHTNEAYSLKLASYIPATQTNINGYYKRLGINFQSFSIFTNGSAQNAWNIRVAQPFFKRTLEVVAGINANDFSNPYVAQGYKSSTVFKSLQVTLRRKRWPVLSLGYFPSEQLMRLSDQQYMQNLFYTMVGSVNHYYKAGNVMYSTGLIYTRFYNRSADSNFVYFNTRNLQLNQSIFLKKLTLQFNLAQSANNDYELYTAEGGIQANCNQWLSVGAGIKYNYQTAYEIKQWGYSGNMILRIPLLGEFRFMADKGFIPGAGRQLVQNNIGRFTYFKTF